MREWVMGWKKINHNAGYGHGTGRMETFGQSMGGVVRPSPISKSRQWGWSRFRKGLLLSLLHEAFKENRATRWVAPTAAWQYSYAITAPSIFSSQALVFNPSCPAHVVSGRRFTDSRCRTTTANEHGNRADCANDEGRRTDHGDD